MRPALEHDKCRFCPGHLARLPEFDFEVSRRNSLASVVPVASLAAAVVAGQQAVIGGELEPEGRMAGSEQIVVNVLLRTSDVARRTQLRANLKILRVPHPSRDEFRAAHVPLIMPRQPVLGAAMARFATDAVGDVEFGLSSRCYPFRIMALCTAAISFGSSRRILFRQSCYDLFKLWTDQGLC